MPLSAYINGEYVYGPAIADDAWAALRRDRAREVTLPCGRPGFLRVSPRGTKHFVHRTNHDECPWAHESADHVDAKRTLVDALRDTDWTVRTEQCGADWRADVLAIAPDGRRRVAFEVQLSPQSYDETVVRQRRFIAAGVEGVWLFRSLPVQFYSAEPDPHLPMFALARDERDAWRVTVRRFAFRRQYAEWVDEGPPGPAGTLPLGQFARSWLAGAGGLRPMLRMMPEWLSRIDVFRATCPECARENVLYAVRTPRVSACGVLVTERHFAPVYETQFVAHLRAYGLFGVRTLERVTGFFAGPDAPRAEGAPVRVRYSYRADEHANRLLCQWCSHVYTGPEYEALAESAPRVTSLDWPVPNPDAFAALLSSEVEMEMHWCLAPAGAECPTKRAKLTDETAARIDAYSAARQAERDTWPVYEIAAEVKRIGELAGWRTVRTHLGSGGPRYWFAKKGRKVLTHTGTGEWSVDGIRQVFADADEAGIGLLWLTPDQRLADHPALRGRSIIPVRATRLGASGWDFFVVLGPGEERRLPFAVPVLLAALGQ